MFGVVGQSGGGRERDLVKIEVLGREGHGQRCGRFHLGIAGNFPGIEAGLAGEEDVPDHAVKGLAIIEFVIVSAGIVIHVPAQALGVAVELEDRFGGIEQGLQGVAGGKATVVAHVEREQGGATGDHCGHVRVVGDGGEIVGRLLGIAEIGGIDGVGEVAGITGDWIAQGHARIEGADGDGLPTAAGKAAHGDARGIGVGQGEQEIEAP